MLLLVQPQTPEIAKPKAHNPNSTLLMVLGRVDGGTSPQAQM